MIRFMRWRFPQGMSTVCISRCWKKDHVTGSTGRGLGAAARSGHDASVYDSASSNGKTRLVRGICSSNVRCVVDLDVVRDTEPDEEDEMEVCMGAVTTVSAGAA